jgi:WD40 repeat protein
VKVWRLSDLKCIESLNAHDDAVNAMVLDSDRLLFTGSADGTVKLWKRIMAVPIEGTSKKQFTSKTRQRHDLISTLRLRHRSSVNSIVVSRDGCLVYVGYSDGIIRYWMKGNSNELPVEITYIGRLAGHRLAVLCMAVCGETMICSGSADRTIRVWRREGGVHEHCCMAVIEGHRGPVKSIAATTSSSINYLTENGYIIYSGDLDKTLKAWLIQTV